MFCAQRRPWTTRGSRLRLELTSRDSERNREGTVNWDAVGAIGEVAGAVAVVGTLFYLSRQISQNSKALDTANERASTALVHDGNSLSCSY